MMLPVFVCTLCKCRGQRMTSGCRFSPFIMCPKD